MTVPDVVKLQGGPGSVGSTDEASTARLVGVIGMPNKRTMPRICRQCGRDFLAAPAVVKAGYGHFCSQRCNAAFSSAARAAARRAATEQRYPPGETHRACTKCALTKPLEDYTRHRTAPNGRAWQCKACMYPAHRQWSSENLEAGRKYKARRRAANPDRARASDRLRDREKKRAKDARYVERHRVELYARRMQAYYENPEPWRLRREYRRARLAGVDADLTREQWAQIKAMFNFQCAYCGVCPEVLTQDHVIPLARGGAHTFSNVVPACKSCNSRKQDGPAPPFKVRPADWDVLKEVL